MPPEHQARRDRYDHYRDVVPLAGLIGATVEGNRHRQHQEAHRWQDEAVRAGRTITRIAVAFEAGRDGFWLALWLACARS